jgi:hypothetical protein
MTVPDTGLSGKTQNISSEDEQKVVAEAKAAKEAHQDADDLRAQAEKASDDAERDKLLAKAQEREDESRAHSKEARDIASGAWQGTVGGVGVGTGIGTGTGAIVGTLVGTIASVPFAGLGALVGLPIGLIHGPFVGGKDQKSGGQNPSEDEQHQAVIQAVDRYQEEEGKNNSK